jgi:carotenoid cleavage dioxygenase-like enzyme
MTTFPKTPSFTGFNTPSRIEADISFLNVQEGAIPPELDGAFYRVQPDPQFPPRLGDDIAFNGDGMISRFRIKNGRVDFKQRWARTDKWGLENAAGRALFGAYRNPINDDPSVKGKIRGTANTNAFIHSGKLYGLKEDSPPLVMDPVSMETEGYTNFGNKMKGETFTAHPKIDPETGNMAGFGYASKGLLTKDMTYYEISPEGKLLYDIWFETPYYCMMHDFAITRDYALFSVSPITSNWERLEAGLPHFGFDTTLPTYLAVVPRKAGATATDVRWFKGDNRFSAHVMNGYQEGNKVHIDMPVAMNNFFPFFPDIHGAPFDRKEGVTHMTRWTADLDSEDDTYIETRLSDLMAEFPKIDDRYTSKKYRYGWVCVMDPSRNVEAKGGGAAELAMNCLGLLDLETGKEQVWWAGPTSSVQEPCFIPRSADAPEGDGWIVMVCNRLATHTSDLLLFDALEIKQGPIAIINLPIRLRFGLHGNWVNADSVGLD